MADQDNPAIHPAEAGFSRTWETVKCVGAKALKWGAYGALAMGALYLLGGGLIITPIVGFLGGIFSALTGSSAIFGTVSTMAATLVPTLLTGGVIGAVLGAVKGVASAGDEVEEKLQDRIADYEANETRQMRNRIFRSQQAQYQDQVAVSPQNIGAGRVAGRGLG